MKRIFFCVLAMLAASAAGAQSLGYVPAPVGMTIYTGGSWVPLIGTGVGQALGYVPPPAGLYTCTASPCTNPANWQPWNGGSGGGGVTITSPFSTVNVGGSSSSPTLDVKNPTGYINAAAPTVLGGCGAIQDWQWVKDAVVTASSVNVTSPSNPWTGQASALTGQAVRIERAGTSNNVFTTTIAGVTGNTLILTNAPPNSASPTRIGWGTDNNSAISACFTAHPGSTIYFPATAAATVGYGKCYYSSANVTDTQALNIVNDGCIAFAATDSGIVFQPTWGNSESVSALTEGWSLASVAVNNAGTSCNVGDILEISQTPYAPKNERSATRIQVSTTDGSGHITGVSVLDPGVMLNASPGATPTFSTVSGSCTGATFNTAVWNTPPDIGQVNVTELTIGGTNGLNAASSCDLLDDGTQLCIGNVIKLIGNRHYPWNYSNGQTGVTMVAARVANGGSGYSASDVLTATIFSTSVPVGRASVIPNQNGYSTTLPQVTVDTVGTTGNILTYHVSNAGNIKYVTFDPVAFSGGGGSGATFYPSWDVPTNTAGTYAEMATVTGFPDATHLLLDKVLLTPFASTVNGTTNPYFRVVPNVPFSYSGNGYLTCADDNHDVSLINRLPALISIRGATTPKVTVTAKDACAVNVEALSTWMGNYDVTAVNSDDLPTANDYGYGGVDEGGSTSDQWSLRCEGTRHCFSSGSQQNGTYANSTSGNIVYAGSSWYPHIRSLNGTHLLEGVDTHEDTYGPLFDNIQVAIGKTPSYPGVNGGGGPGNAGAALGMRGYDVTINGAKVSNTTQGVGISSELFPFSGLFGQPDIFTLNNLDFQGSRTMTGPSGVGYGVYVQGPSAAATNNWGGTDWLAKIIISNSTLVGCSSFAAVDSDEGIYGMYLNNVTSINCDQLLRTIGPTNIQIDGAKWIEDQPTYRVSSAGPIIQRNIASAITGAQDVYINNLSINYLNNTGSNPSSVFRTLDTVSTNQTNIWMGAITTPGHAKLTSCVTSGATCVVQDAEANPFHAIRKITATGVSLGSTGDAAIIPVPKSISKYIVTGVFIGNTTTSLTTALAGVWSAASKGGTNVAANQALSGLTGTATQSLALTLTTAMTGNPATMLTASNLYVNVGTAQAATVDVTIEIQDLTQN